MGRGGKRRAVQAQICKFTFSFVRVYEATVIYTQEPILRKFENGVLARIFEFTRKEVARKRKTT